MPRSRRIEPFCLVVDRDCGTFAVEGPMTDDTRWNNAVCRAQKEGREVNYSSGGINCDQVAADYQATYGLHRVAPGTIVKPRLDD